MFLTLTLLVTYVSLVWSHGYVNYPISRNALSSISNGYCSWSGGDSSIPCTGDSHSWNVEEPSTGCGIKQGGGLPYVFGNGALSFANTGFLTTFQKGQVIDMDVKITVWHGGKLEFRLQDVGANQNDPVGSLWSSSPLLRVESFSPACDNARLCGFESCTLTNSCAQVPMSAYGNHDGNYRMAVKLPDDMECEHCVLQWKYTTANSCGGTHSSCDQSEKFWNCVDLKITNGGLEPGTSPVPTATLTTAPSTTRAPTLAPTTTPSTSRPTVMPISEPCVDSNKFKINEPRKWKNKNCNWMGKKPTQRCMAEDKKGVPGYEACPVSCGTCPTPPPTYSPTRHPTVSPSNSVVPTEGGGVERVCYSVSHQVSDAWCLSVSCHPAYEGYCAWGVLGPPTLQPTGTDGSVVTCHSVSPQVSDDWCISVACHSAYAGYCLYGPVITAYTPTPQPTTQTPTHTSEPTEPVPTEQPILSPTLRPSSSSSSSPSLSSSPSPSPDSNPAPAYIGIYDWTWDGATATPPPGVTFGVAFNGWASIDQALYESNLMMSTLPGDKFISIGGGNTNGHLTPSSLSALNTAMTDGRLSNYQGICYDVEEGDAGMGAAFSQSFAMAKANNFKVIVTVSHSAPYGFTDKIALMRIFFNDPNIDYISPQLYTTGTEIQNDYVWSGVPWSEYANSRAPILPSIVRASYYADVFDFFLDRDRSGAGISIAGYIEWTQST